MYNEKTIKILRTVVLSALVILMFITVVLKVWAFEALRHAILCNCILMLLTVALVFDGILKDRKEMITHCLWYALWLYYAIMNQSNF